MVPARASVREPAVRVDNVSTRRNSPTPDPVQSGPVPGKQSVRSCENDGCRVEDFPDVIDVLLQAHQLQLEDLYDPVLREAV